MLYRDRYKELLARAILATGIIPNLGGIEFAEDIVREMDIDRAAAADPSFRRFAADLRKAFRNLM